MRSPAATFDLRAALTTEITEAIAELEAAPQSEKGVHRCRVRLKRARALARIGRACAPGLSDVFNDTARAVMHTLAQARDLAALSATARGLAETQRRKRAAALEAVADALDRARASLPPLDLDSVRMNLRDLLALAQVWPEASERQIEKGVQRVVLRARSACRRGHDTSAAARRHAWRKREKDRLYAAELLGDAWPSERPRRRKLGARLGHLLGQERDALLLIERLDHDDMLAGAERASKRALKALRRHRHRLGGRADELGLRLHRGRG